MRGCQASSSRVTTFAAGSGKALQTTVTHGTASTPNGVANKTTREVSIVDELGHAVRDERYLYVSGGYVLASWAERQYDAEGHLTGTQHSTGEEERASWGCCTQDSHTC